MIELLSYSLLVALCGTLLVANLVLVKGEICPGQRGRLHQALGWVLVVLAPTVLTLTGMVQMLAAMAFVLLAVFLFKQRRAKKVATSALLPLLYAASGLVLLSVLTLLASQPWQMSLLLTTQFLLLGACASHWLLVKARSRLQAFHRILPILGVISAIFMAITLAIVGSDETQNLSQVLQSLLTALGLMLLGVSVWVVPIIQKQAAKLWQLNLTVLVEIAACVTALNIA